MAQVKGLKISLESTNCSLVQLSLDDRDWTNNEVKLVFPLIEDTYEKILLLLSCHLDEYHRVSYGVDGWRIALGAWLMQLIHPIIAHFDFLGTSSNKQDKSNCFPCFDAKDFARDLTQHPEVQYSFLFQVRQLRENPSKSLPTDLIRKTVKGLIPVIRPPSQEHVNIRAISIPSYAQKLLDESVILSNTIERWSLLMSPKKERFFVDRSWRLSPTHDSSLTHLQTVCLRMARMHVPIYFLEAFAQNRTSIPKSKKEGVFFTSNALYFDNAFSHYLAEYRSSSKLLSYQHGGGYGIDYNSVNERFERKVSDTFFSWGWSDNLPPTPPVPLANPPRLRMAKKFDSKACLLICVNYPKIIYKVGTYPMGDRVEKLIESTCTFLKCLSCSVGMNIRPYPHDYGRNCRERLASASIFNIESESNTKLWRQYSRCPYGLVIANYLGTSWLETLAANIPTVCFYDPEVYAFREDAAPFMDELLETEILHASPESAAEHVNRIHHDPEKWWRRSEIQELRECFCYRYAHMSDDWTLHWIEAFECMLHSKV